MMAVCFLGIMYILIFLDLKEKLHRNFESKEFYNLLLVFILLYNASLR